MTPENIEVVRASVTYALTMLEAFKGNPMAQYSGVLPGIEAIVSQLKAAQGAIPKAPEPEKPVDPMLAELLKMNEQIAELVKKQSAKP